MTGVVQARKKPVVVQAVRFDGSTTQVGALRPGQGGVVKRVVVVSPYAGDVERNLRYAKAALSDSLSRGEAPFASHLLYPQVLDDLDPAQRHQAMEAARRWIAAADTVVVYEDLGESAGMTAEMDFAMLLDIEVVWRTLGKEWQA